MAVKQLEIENGLVELIESYNGNSTSFTAIISVTSAR
jgi:UDP-N-acetylmuramyl pentapeptide synthase